MPSQDTGKERLHARVVETSIALHQAAGQGGDTSEALAAHADAVRALLAWEERQAAPPPPPGVQQLVEGLAQDLAAHVEHEGLKPEKFAYIRRGLEAARAAVLAIPGATDPHLAAAHALAAVERTRLNWPGEPPSAGRGGYVARVDAVIEATAPEPPHPFRRVSVPVRFVMVDADVPGGAFMAYVQAQGAWYSRHCLPPDEVREFSATVKHGETEPTPYPWQEARPGYVPSARSHKVIPVEFPLLVRGTGREWDGWRAWVPAPTAADEERAPQPDLKELT